jgi:hypothetical protein
MKCGRIADSCIHDSGGESGTQACACWRNTMKPAFRRARIASSALTPRILGMPQTVTVRSMMVNRDSSSASVSASGFRYSQYILHTPINEC